VSRRRLSKLTFFLSSNQSTVSNTDLNLLKRPIQSKTKMWNNCFHFHCKPFNSRKRPIKSVELERPPNETALQIWRSKFNETMNSIEWQTHSSLSTKKSWTLNKGKKRRSFSRHICQWEEGSKSFFFAGACNTQSLSLSLSNRQTNTQTHNRRHRSSGFAHRLFPQSIFFCSMGVLSTSKKHL
jgi:hypothetical protein